MSGLNNYLEDLFVASNLSLPEADNQLPALHANGIFPSLSCVIPTRRTGNETVQRIATRMSSVRQSIKHLFAFHYNLLTLFRQPENFRLLISGIEGYKLLFNSFLLWNVYHTIYCLADYFAMAPLTLEEYLPTNEQLVPGPNNSDEDLGTVYHYHV